jgi:hypothetical protein
MAATITAVQKKPNRKYPFSSIILPPLSPAEILTFHANFFSNNNPALQSIASSNRATIINLFRPEPLSAQNSYGWKNKMNGVSLSDKVSLCQVLILLIFLPMPHSLQASSHLLRIHQDIVVVMMYETDTPVTSATSDDIFFRFTGYKRS